LLFWRNNHIQLQWKKLGTQHAFNLTFIYLTPELKNCQIPMK
jgi:hypothetical protein